MATAIWKYQIPVSDNFTLNMPFDANIIRVDNVDGLLYLWAIVDTDEDLKQEERHFNFYKTGQAIEAPYASNYIGHCKIFIGQELCLYLFEHISNE